MAYLALINGSTANALPSSQIPSTVPDTTDTAFLTMLTQVANAANDPSAADQGDISSTNGTNAGSTPILSSPPTQLASQITKLLDGGLSIDSVTHTIATKLVKLAGGESQPNFAQRVNAVAQYLRQGESATASTDATAKSIAAKVRALVTALRQPSPAPQTSTTESGNILDAAKAGDTPTAPDPTAAAAPAAPAPPTQQAPPTSVEPPAPAVPVAQPPATSDQSVFALALQALRTSETTPVASSATLATNIVPVPAPISSAAQVPAAPPVQTATAPSAPTAPVVPASPVTAVAAAASEQSSAPSQTPPFSNAQPTLGQLSVLSSPQVATDLSAIAAGQGTALGRALLRAANVDVAGSGSTLASVDATLSSLAASLDDAVNATAASADGSGAKSAGQNGGASVDASLGEAAIAALTSSAPGTTQTTFASTLAKSQAPIDVDDIMEQVVRGVSLKNFGDNPTVNISLNPPHLGELSVKLSVSDATVNATVTAQSSDIKAILLNNRAELDQTLAAAGLKLGSLTVDVGGQSLQQDAERRQAQRDQVFTGGTQSTPADVASDPALEPSSGPSMLGSVDLSLLNQLV